MRRTSSEAWPTMPVCVACDAALLRRDDHRADLADGVCEGLLAVDMFAHLHGGESCDGVDVVGGADDDCIDILVGRLKHDAPVVEAFCLRVLRSHLGGESATAGKLLAGSPIDVADSYYVLAGEFYEVLRAVVADADERDVGFIVGGELSCRVGPGRQSTVSARYRSPREKSASRDTARMIQPTPSPNLIASVATS